ncbi:MAG: VPLPA-CTERM sorting domain-containing protein, partial [Litoreibacter sp.]
STGADFEYDFFGLNNIFVGAAAFDGSSLSAEVDLGFGLFTIFDGSGDVRDEFGFSDVFADGTSVSAVLDVVGASSGDYENGGILQLFDFSPALGTDSVDILSALNFELVDSGESLIPVTASISVQALAPIDVVPLPAGGVLLLTALGGLALRRRMTA